MAPSTSSLLAALLLGTALHGASAGLSPPSTRLLSTARTPSLRDAAIMAKASPNEAGSKAAAGTGGQMTLVLGKISDGASAARLEAEKLAGDAKLRIRQACDRIEGTLKEYPAESAVAAALALTLALLLGEGEVKPEPAKPSILGSVFSAGNQTAKVLASATGSCLEGPASMASGCLSASAKQIGPLMGAAMNGTASLATELALALTACAAATPGALNKTFWTAEKGVVEVACAIADLSFTLAGRCSDGACAYGKAVGSWGEDLATNTTFRVKNVINAVTAIVNPTALKYTVKAGSLKSGSFTVDLGTTKVVGAVIVENKKCKQRKNKDMVLAGTHEFDIFVSEDGKTWTRAHRGSLSPGAPKAKSQYVTFEGKWARYVKFLSVSSYKGGAGLGSIYLHSPIGLNTLHWILRFKDTLHSVYEANAPVYWSQIEMPPCTDVQSRIVYGPLLLSKYLGLKVPDDLWLGNVTRACAGFSEGCEKATKAVTDSTKAAVNMTCSAASSACSVVALATEAVSAAASSAATSLSKINSFGLGRLSKTLNSTASVISTGISAAKSPFAPKKVVVRDTSNSCLPVSIVGLLGLGGGAYYYKEPIGGFVGPYAEELKVQAEKVKGHIGGVARDVSSKIQEASKSLSDSVEKAGAGARSQAGKAAGGKVDDKSGAAAGGTGPRRFGKA